MKKNTMKKGITLIEIILAIVLIAVILGVTIPKLMSSSQRGEISTVISSDVNSIAQAANLWKKANGGTGFYFIDGGDIQSRLPANMSIDSTFVITSAGFPTGLTNNGAPATGPRYVLQHSIDGAAATTNLNEISLAIDLTYARDNLGWDTQTIAYAQDVFSETVRELMRGNGQPTQINTGTIDSGAVANGAVIPASFTAASGGTSFTCAATGVVRCLQGIVLSN